MTCHAHYIAAAHGNLNWEDVDLIMRQVKALRRVKHINVVDLGAGAGTTACSVLAERREGVTIYTIDNRADNLEWARSNVAKAGGADCWHSIQADSAEVPWERPIHLLMLDTAHNYAQTVRELDAWLPHMAQDSRVWVHDYRGAYPGVTQAVDEAIAAGKLGMLAIAGLGVAMRIVR